MHIGFKHFLKRQKSQVTKPVNGDGMKKTMDRFIYILTPVTVLIFVPQLAKIWIDKNISGVSLVSWFGMLIGSFFWFLYGIIHKEKPMIFVNIAIGTIQFLIVLGILIYR